MPDMLLLEAEERMEKTVESYQKELNTVRTGRANPNLMDAICIDYYGVMTPIKQIDLGLNPQSDGTGIRLIIPKMTEERRRELTKQVGKMQEAAKVAIRNIRRDVNDALKKLSLPEDEEKGWLEDSQKATDEYTAKIDKVTAVKEKELMTI